MTFGEKLKFIREERKMLYDQCAISLGITEQTYRNMESGNSDPKLSSLIKYARLFEVSIDYFTSEFTAKEYLNFRTASKLASYFSEFDDATLNYFTISIKAHADEIRSKITETARTEYNRKIDSLGGITLPPKILESRK